MAETGDQLSLDHMPPMVFCVAKGAPDACGAGCDTWIAAEGRVDNDAADRFRKFWHQQKDHQPGFWRSEPIDAVALAVRSGNNPT